MEVLMAPLVAVSCPKSMANKCHVNDGSADSILAVAGELWRMLATFAEQGARPREGDVAVMAELPYAWLGDVQAFLDTPGRTRSLRKLTSSPRRQEHSGLWRGPDASHAAR